MPISKETEELIALVKDSESQKQLRELVDKSADLDQALKEGVLRQSDYSRKQSELQVKAREAEATITKYTGLYEQNVAWRSEHEGKFTDLNGEVARLTKENAEKERQIKEAVANSTAVQGGEVTKEQLEIEVKRVLAGTGAMTQEQIDNVVKNSAAEVVKSEAALMKKDFYEKDLPATNQFLMDMVDTAFSHQREFGEPIDREKLADFMREHSLTNPKKAYEEFVAGRRNDLKIKSETEKAAQEAEKRVREEYSKNNIPGATGSAGDNGMGAVQVRRAQEKAAADGTAVGGGASAAAQELKAAGKF